MSTIKIAATSAAVAVALTIVFIAATTAVLASTVSPATAAPVGDTADCDPTNPTTNKLAGYQHDQIANAATIVAVGKQLNIPPQGWVVATAAAIQESGLHNPSHGDRDSLGLFQQRPSQGWGTPAHIMNPTYSATQFYRHLLATPDWQSISINDAAQAVQRSATPHAYAPHEQAAAAIVDAIQASVCARPDRAIVNTCG